MSKEYCGVGYIQACHESYQKLGVAQAEFEAKAKALFCESVRARSDIRIRDELEAIKEVLRKERRQTCMTDAPYVESIQRLIAERDKLQTDVAEQKKLRSAEMYAQGDQVIIAEDRRDKAEALLAEVMIALRETQAENKLLKILDDAQKA